MGIENANKVTNLYPAWLILAIDVAPSGKSALARTFGGVNIPINYVRVKCTLRCTALAVTKLSEQTQQGKTDIFAN